MIKGSKFFLHQRRNCNGLFLEAAVTLILTAGILVTMGYYAVGSRQPYNQALDNVMENRATAKDNEVLQNANREMAQTYENITAVGGLIGATGPGADTGISNVLRPLESSGAVQYVIYPAIMDSAQQSTKPPAGKNNPDPAFRSSQPVAAAPQTSRLPQPSPLPEPSPAPHPVSPPSRTPPTLSSRQSDHDLTGSVWKVTQFVNGKFYADYQAKILSVDSSGHTQIEVTRLTPYSKNTFSLPPGGIAKPAIFSGTFDGQMLQVSGQWYQYLEAMPRREIPGLSRRRSDGRLVGGQTTVLEGRSASVKTNNITYRLSLNPRLTTATGQSVPAKESSDLTVSATRLK